MQNTILIIDDEKKLSGLLARIIGLEGYNVLEAATGKEGLKVLIQEDVLLVISDVKLPDVNGVDLVTAIKEKKPYVEVINLTAYGTIADGVKAIKNGAFNYIIKGDDNDKIIPLISQAMEKAALQLRVFELEKKVTNKYSFARIIGTSKPILEAVSLARKVAATDTTVLLLGETGTGKEVFASAIHYESQRRLMPFVAVNCSSFSAELLESELFGYKAGAFTGALKDKKGLFEEAQHGTIFLDEIGEMSHELQAKLLRVLENKTFIKVGDTQTTKVNIRILAATNRDLQQEAEAGHFRLDLYYRLSVFSISLPSLNDRKGDVELLANYYLKEFTAKAGRRMAKLTPEFLNLLNRHHWKGNIRELKNVIERVVILADDDTLDADLLPLEFRQGSVDHSALDLATIERQHIQKVLIHAQGNKTETARLLGIGLTTLYRKLDEYKLG
ncbi:DNA-binding transcriptional response regulator, NtrC family, contains REC, AAA-type ATPase, and a Fis-type DNA-binding domains [Mucilaginibacter pineti]|uniref:DNA-binding transcriptional response regulator, NtrC family, contains REC, AAA-type ATPase, and a Fis-type DNA-binding domains n=1 Tax=Mucilaginibacter pineti TaxID=1391627 RepID=A0A1G7EYA2_9SPHI|nr:sigma-54 dependent transcriptional regulator [Mucilaginibacter pineti]SDE68690.1 DNA-binding transcriptional response regulator, NtrC family, contains REC, AAA-type ATPase, and a Fis-type DNA-binding domains [Mucilaginibacter pineti]